MTPNNKSSQKEEVANAVSYLTEGFRKLASQYNSDFLRELCRQDQYLSKKVADYTTRCYEELERNLQDKEMPDPSSYFTKTGYVMQAGKTKNRKLISKVKSDFLYNSRKLFLDFQETSLLLQRDILKDGYEWVFSETRKIIEESPEYIKVFYSQDELVSMPGDKVSVKIFKFRKRTWASLTGKPIAVKIPLRELIAYHLPGKLRLALYVLLKTYGKSGFKQISGLQAMFYYMKKSFVTIEESLIRGDFSHELLQKEKRNALNLIAIGQKESSNGRTNSADDELTSNSEDKSLPDEAAESALANEVSDHKEQYNDLDKIKLPIEESAIIGRSLKNTIGLISEDIGRADIIGLMRRRKQMQINSGEKLHKKIAEIPDNWYRNQTLFLSAALMDLLLQSAQNQLGIIVQKVMSKLRDTFNQNVLENLERDHNKLKEFAEKISVDPFAEFITGRTDWGYARDKVFYKELNDKLLADIKETINLFPDTIEIMGEPRPVKGKKSLDLFEEKQYEKVESISISLNRLLNYLIQTHLSEPIRSSRSILSPTFIIP